MGLAGKHVQMKDTITRTLNDSSTMWGTASGIYGALTISEWCLLITAVVTVSNFIKNWYIDMRKLKMLEEEHKTKLKLEMTKNEND